MLSVSQVPETSGSKEGNCGRKQKKGFQILTYLFQPVPLLIFIAINKVCLTVHFDS